MPNIRSLIRPCDADLAQKTVDLAREMGLNVPRELSVATYGDIMPQSTLTAIHLPISQIAAKCVEILEQMMRGEQPSVSVPVAGASLSERLYRIPGH
jgi:DNA-binding LacI/PurR family transcriptional regulator